VFIMPIRFRCAYCNQLLGIARRKSGTVVRCPTCAGHVVVPNLPAEEPENTEKTPDSVFERSDFDELLSEPRVQAMGGEKKEGESGSSDAPVAISSAEPPPGAWGTHAEPPYSVARLNPSSSAIASAEPVAQPLGMVLTSRKTRLFAILGGLGFIVMFLAGILVGYLIRG
jgi:hypothetical protein